MRIWRGEEGETDEVIAIFEFSEVPGAFEAPENFDLVIEVKGAQIWASKLD
jgi:hypothetical protein